MFNYITNLLTCREIITNEVPIGLINYAHISTIVMSLIIGFFVLYKKRNLISIMILGIAISFSFWALFDLISWVSFSSVYIMFAWSVLGIFDILLFISTYYFFRVYTNEGCDILFIEKVVLFLILFPVLLMTPTVYNLVNFNYYSCEAVGNEFGGYIYFAELLVLVMIIISFVISVFKNKEKIFQKSIVFLGVFLFLTSFFSLGYISEYFGNIYIEPYGLFGMLFFVGFLAYGIVKFKAFNIKLIGAQALTWALVIFIGSQFLYMDKMPLSSLIITAITLVMSAVIGLMIVRGIKKEIAIRERIESLADQLEHTNERLRELDQQKSQFVSLASHQLRAPLTSIKGYLSMILEGDYGPVEGEMRVMIERVIVSANNLVTIVGDFLDVSRIEQGAMRYEWTDFDLKPLVETVQKELTDMATRKGLVLNLNIESGIQYNVHGDMNKLKQVFTNLIDNSIKYTPKGEVKISLTHPMPSTIRLEIKDTGIGISAETLPKLFDNFVRAEGANSVNVIGTGLGLFVAKEMIKAHEGGKIWAESEGLGKGSRFIVELKAL